MPERTSRLRQFASLSRSQQRTLLASAAWMPLFALSLRLLGLARCQSLLYRTPMRPRLDAMPLDQIRAIGTAVNIAARHAFPARCLTRSLLLVWLLRRRGVRADLRIGVSTAGGSFRAHAWVECDGVPVNDRPDVASEFASFGDIVPASAFRTP
jgi:hypothetical protein